MGRTMAYCVIVGQVGREPGDSASEWSGGMLSSRFRLIRRLPTPQPKPEDWTGGRAERLYSRGLTLRSEERGPAK